MVIELPWPPTANTYWRHPTKGKLAGRHLLSEKGRAYRSDVAVAVLQQRAVKRLKGPVRVTVKAYMPDRRRRDLDNLAKGLFDAMTYAGVWDDDSQIDDVRIYRARDDQGELVLQGKIVVRIEVMR